MLSKPTPQHVQVWIIHNYDLRIKNAITVFKQDLHGPQRTLPLPYPLQHTSGQRQFNIIFTTFAEGTSILNVPPTPTSIVLLDRLYLPSLPLFDSTVPWMWTSLSSKQILCPILASISLWYTERGVVLLLRLVIRLLQERIWPLRYHVCMCAIAIISSLFRGSCYEKFVTLRIILIV